MPREAAVAASVASGAVALVAWAAAWATHSTHFDHLVDTHGGRGDVCTTRPWTKFISVPRALRTTLYHAKGKSVRHSNGPLDFRSMGLGRFKTLRQERSRPAAHQGPTRYKSRRGA